jgi:hypothetical protein
MVSRIFAKCQVGARFGSGQQKSGNFGRRTIRRLV